MFAGAWCGQLGVTGWVLMGLFWATFLGLVLWAVSRLFGSGRAGGLEGDRCEADDVDELGPRLAGGELDVTEHRALRPEFAARGLQDTKSADDRCH